jgi:hypothetical protein
MIISPYNYVLFLKLHHYYLKVEVEDYFTKVPNRFPEKCFSILAGHHLKFCIVGRNRGRSHQDT